MDFINSVSFLGGKSVAHSLVRRVKLHLDFSHPSDCYAGFFVVFLQADSLFLVPITGFGLCHPVLLRSLCRRPVPGGGTWSQSAQVQLLQTSLCGVSVPCVVADV